MNIEEKYFGSVVRSDGGADTQRDSRQGIFLEFEQNMETFTVQQTILKLCQSYILTTCYRVQNAED